MAEPPVFVLAPPHGLGAHLAAWLGRHPSLLDLPALHLLCGDTPGEVARRWGDRLPGHGDGLIRAACALLSLGEAEAAAWALARRDRPSHEVLTELAEAAHPRRLIDASFLHAADEGALDRLARAFPTAPVIHLLRHPAAVLTTPEAARARSEALWLRPHLRIHAALAKWAPLGWVRLRAEWLAEDPRPRLAALLDWLGAPLAAPALDRLLDASRVSPNARPGPPSAPHGVDPMLVADPSLSAQLACPPAPDLDEAGWEAAGLDAETRAMARLWGYS